MGISYAKICRTLTKSEKIKYMILENKNVCEYGRSLFKTNKNINFVERLPSFKDKKHILFISSAFQYIDNWKELMANLTKYKPIYFVFENMNVGDIKSSFVTTQTYYEHKIPCRFFNIDDIKEEMSLNGFDLIFKSNFKANILGKYIQAHGKFSYRIQDRVFKKLNFKAI